MHITPAHLTTLIAVAELGSMIAAARHLRYAPSTVSAHITSIERQIGGPVVERTPDGARLTPHGERATGIARRILALYDEMTATTARRAASSARRANLT